MKKMNLKPVYLFAGVGLLLMVTSARGAPFGFFSTAYDEAYIAHQAGDFTDAQVQILKDGSSEDFFHDMDYGVTNPANQEKLRQTLDTYVPGISKEDAVATMARGRNNWIVWTGGNDRFWSHLNKTTLGALDFLKTVSDEPSLPATRTNRWEELGLVNEPCFEKTNAPREDRFGLWLPSRGKGCQADPFESETKYPGVKIGARGTTLQYRGKAVNFPVGSSYGYASGVVGLRLFPNPDFDQKAADKWDPVRYYTDEVYYSNPQLVRPYRVGMACAFCHVGPNPSNPPKDFGNPAWSNLTSNVGAQYFWFDRVFFWNYKKRSDSFVYQLLHVDRPGALDTSLVSSDQIVNPRTMNAVYDIPARLAVMQKFGNHEKLTGAELGNAQFDSLPEHTLSGSSPLRHFFNPSNNTVSSPRVLKDGSDSVGMLGALNRVYVNIGLFSEEWTKHFIPLIGGPDITPFPIEKAKTNSIYWQAVTNQTPDLALFFAASTKPDSLAAAPGGKAYLQKESSPQLALGKKVFAANCAACHSSKLPENSYTFFNRNNDSCSGDNYMTCWKGYWDYTHSSEFKDEMQKIVSQPDFLKNNYLSTDLRVPVTLTDTQLCSPVATNAIKGSIWDNFSSTTYKTLGSVGDFKVNYPNADGSSLVSDTIAVPAGGRGFVRPPSLISVWSTAPFLQNNSLGKFDWHGTVQGRMDSFNDSIHQLLWPETRSAGQSFPGKQVMSYTTQWGDTLHGVMDVTTEDSYLKLPKSYLPKAIQEVLDLAVTKDKAATTYASHPLMTKGPRIPSNLSKPFESKANWFDRMVASVFGKKKAADRSVASSMMAELQETSTPDDDEIYYNIGPFPAGIPVNLIGNFSFEAGVLSQAEAATKMIGAIIELRHQGLEGEAARKYFMEFASQALIKASSCTDFVVNKGHYFGTQYSEDAKKGASQPLSDAEKSALIEFLKTM